MSTTTHTGRGPLIAAVAEALEARRLLASYLDDGTLYVNGTSGNDVILVHDRQAVERTTVEINGSTATYLADDVDRMIVAGHGGNDRLTVELSPFDKPDIAITIGGGSGNDTIFHHEDAIPAQFFGGRGDDHLVFDGVSAPGFSGGGGRDKLSLIDEGDDLDLRRYATVEDGYVNHGTLIGNDLDNHLSIGQGWIYGLDGNDTLVGGDGSPLFGGDGNDWFVNSDFSQRFVGGAGSDVVDYSRETRPVRVSIGDGSVDEYGDFDGNDGPITVYGEIDGDDVAADVEQVRGGTGNDTMFGSAGDNVLRGNAGDDSLVGAGGRDALLGGRGNDVLRGGPGDDYLEGRDGRDALFGGTGHDRLAAGSGNDYLEAGDGDDTLVGNGGSDTLLGQDDDDWLYARDGEQDRVDGGSGADRAQRDSNDSIARVERFI